MKCYIDATHRNDAFQQVRQAAGIAEGSIVNEDGDTLYGVKVYGVPIGSTNYLVLA